MRTDTAKAQAEFEAALPFVQKLVAESPQNGTRRAQLGLLYAKIAFRQRDAGLRSDRVERDFARAFSALTVSRSIKFTSQRAKVTTPSGSRFGGKDSSADLVGAVLSFQKNSTYLGEGHLALGPSDLFVPLAILDASSSEKPIHLGIPDGTPFPQRVVIKPG